MTNKTEANNQFMIEQRDKGFDTVFVGELPYPESVRRCIKHGVALAVVGNVVYIRDEV